MKCGLKPAEAWAMTPFELHQYIEGYEWRRDQFGAMLAGFTATVVSPLAGRRVRGTDLYRPRAKRRLKAAEERRRRFEEVVRFMGPDTIPVVLSKQA